MGNVWTVAFPSQWPVAEPVASAAMEILDAANANVVHGEAAAVAVPLELPETLMGRNHRLSWTWIFRSCLLSEISFARAVSRS